MTRYYYVVTSIAPITGSNLIVGELEVMALLEGQFSFPLTEEFKQQLIVAIREAFVFKARGFTLIHAPSPE